MAKPQTLEVHRTAKGQCPECHKPNTKNVVHTAPYDKRKGNPLQQLDALTRSSNAEKPDLTHETCAARVAERIN